VTRKPTSLKTSQLPLDCIIFDLDGTIVDTEPLAVKTLKDLLSELGVPAKEEHVKLITGRKWEVVSEFIEKHYQLPCKMADFEREVLKRYHNGILKGVPTVTGSVQSIRAFSNQLPLALVSGSHRKDILSILDHLQIRDCFQEILGAEDYSKSKPDPEGFNLAFNRLGVDPKRSLIFEDSTAGIESARKAQAWVVAVTDTNHYDLDQSQAHLKIENFSKVDLSWIVSEPWNPKK